VTHWTRWARCSHTLARVRSANCRQNCRQTAQTSQLKGASSLVEAIGRNSNLGHHRKKWADLRRRILNSPPRPASGGTPPRSKRILGATDVDDIVKNYDSGETTQQIGAHFGISKSRVATVLREQGITIRRQGITEEQVKEAATFYAAGRSLEWIGARYNVSHTTVATALRRQEIQLRPRPGWI
jgi:hypothetical protein